jgi:hypothetical protein
MHNEAIANSIGLIIRKHIVLIAAGILLISIVGAASYVKSSSEITFKDDIGNVMTFNAGEHSFLIHNASGFMVSGTYTETSESYNCRNDQGSGETITKVGNDKIEYNGHFLTRKY